MLKRVLLAYARHNKTTGYCQGFNILAALILKVVDFDEKIALTVRVCYYGNNQVTSLIRTPPLSQGILI